MKLLSYRREDGTESVGIWRDELNGPYDLARALTIFAVATNDYEPMVTDMLDLLDAGLVDVELLRDVEEFVDATGLIDLLSEAEDYTIVAPISRPGAIYALGHNYPAHAKEMNVAPAAEPTVFLKTSTSVVGPEDDVVYKNFLTRVDPEPELAVVIGKAGTDIPEDEAMSYVAGYTCLNDVTARDLQAEDKKAGRPWLRSKGIDTFCPMGPFITLTDEISDPVELDVELRVNGETRQKDNTRNMTFSIPKIISYISRYCTLYPGDIISTGTPEGIAPVFPGDVMEVEVENVGVLKNQVVAEGK